MSARRQLPFKPAGACLNGVRNYGTKVMWCTRPQVLAAVHIAQRPASGRAGIRAGDAEGDVVKSSGGLLLEVKADTSIGGGGVFSVVDFVCLRHGKREGAPTPVCKRWIGVGFVGGSGVVGGRGVFKRSFACPRRAPRRRGDANS